MEQTDILIIGAGAVGLSVAAEIAKNKQGSTVTVFEQHEKFGTETSSRNSEVIHAGMYYPQGSLKAIHCVDGMNLLYQFCRQWDIPIKRLGKLIVAQSDNDMFALERLLNQGIANGINDLRLLDSGEVAHLEPNIKSAGAIYSPSSGIFNTYRFMAKLEWLAIQNGAMFAYCHTVTDISPYRDGYIVDYFNPDGSKDSILCQWLINSAGLYADIVATWLGIDLDESGYRLHYCKGDYYSISPIKSGLINRLIYPLPLAELKGLGVHITKSLDSRLRLGPNAIYVDEIDYKVDSTHALEFYNSAKTYLPFLELSDLEPEMTSVRPKLQGPGELFRDFVVKHEKDRGLEGAINLIGIESPGLTACLSIARHVNNIIYL